MDERPERRGEPLLWWLLLYRVCLAGVVQLAKLAATVGRSATSQARPATSAGRVGDPDPA